MLAEVLHVDVAAKTLRLDREPSEISYDYLILAPGSRHSYFGHDAWEVVAPGLKSVEDATEIRRRFLLAFERAEAAETDAERDAYLTFVIVGGGPTGVELSGALPLIARRALAPDFRRIDTRRTRVILLEGGDRILSGFSEGLSRTAAGDLADLGVEVRTGAIVTEVDAQGVSIGAERIQARTVFWAAGNAPSPLGRLLGAPLDRIGRVVVEPDLTIPGHPEIFVIGDLASVVQAGRQVPGVAPAAMQEGTAAAKNILRDIRHQDRRAFRYRNKGDLATIGRSRAIAAFPRFELTGRLAWWFWLRYSYFTYQRGVRLITGKTK